MNNIENIVSPNTSGTEESLKTYNRRVVTLYICISNTLSLNKHYINKYIDVLSVSRAFHHVSSHCTLFPCYSTWISVLSAFHCICSKFSWFLFHWTWNSVSRAFHYICPYCRSFIVLDMDYNSTCFSLHLLILSMISILRAFHGIYS